MTGKNLKEIIELLGITQRKLAELMAVTPQTISAILTAKDVRTSTIERIASVTKMPVSFFFKENADAQNAVASGDSSIAVNNITGNIEAGDTSALQERVQLLEQLLAERERIIEEKERTIKILMEK